MNEKVYMCIDLKSFYASAECAEMGLDPFKTNLVVADASRGKGAICLAITPAMKALGIKNRCRIYEIPEGVEYITAMPRMNMYMRVSAHIYGIYLKFISREDIHPYSVDEVFINAAPYLSMYGKTPKEFAVMLMEQIYKETGITATAGIGTNMFLAKVALDITAKHVPDNIGVLDEESFKRTIQKHRPITDIWGIGRGTARRLERYGVYDLEGVTKLPEQTLYRAFGINAEYLIDHAHGREPCTIADIQSYESRSRSLSNSQILFEDYDYPDALLIMKEMADGLVTELVGNGLYTNSVSLSVGYADRSLRHTGGSKHLNDYTDSYRTIAAALEELYHKHTLVGYGIRQIGISFGGLTYECFKNLSFFEDTEKEQREHDVVRAVAEVKNRFGKNAVLRGMSLQEKATARTRNKLVGGHNGG